MHSTNSHEASNPISESSHFEYAAASAASFVGSHSNEVEPWYSLASEPHSHSTLGPQPTSDNSPITPSTHSNDDERIDRIQGSG